MFAALGLLGEFEALGVLDALSAGAALLGLDGLTDAVDGDASELDGVDVLEEPLKRAAFSLWSSMMRCA